MYVYVYIYIYIQTSTCNKMTKNAITNEKRT